MTETTVAKREATAVDWPTARALYVEGVPGPDGTTTWPSMRDVAERMQVNLRSLGQRAADEEWVRQRAMYQRRVEEARQQERVEEIARLAADVDVAALKAARDGLSITHARIQELGVAANRRMQALADRQVPNDPPSDALELERLARAVDGYYTTAVTAIGLAPRTPLDALLQRVETETDAETRDARTIGVLALIKQHAPEMMPAHLEEVVDVGSVVALVPGGSPPGDLGDGDAETEPVPVDDADVG